MGRGASNTAPWAPLSTASRPPPDISRTSMPSAASFRRSSDSFSFSAASADLTTSSCVKPSSCASILRSTSGSTSRYVALEPSSTGAGNFSGHDRASSRPAFRIRTSGVVPPPENARPTVVTFGATLPSAERVRPVSMGCHAPFTRARTGRRYSRASKLPSGVAKTSLRSPRIEAISTDRPVRFASVNAASAPVRDSPDSPASPTEATGGAVGVAAAWGARVASTASPTPPATSPVALRLRSCHHTIPTPPTRDAPLTCEELCGLYEDPV